MVIVINSIPKLTIVLPVPATEFSHTVPTDIVNNATETMRITGIAS